MGARTLGLLRRLRFLAGALVLSVPAACGGTEHATTAQRNLRTVAIDGNAEVVLAVAVVHRHEGLTDTGGGGGRGSLPTGIRMPVDHYRPRPVVTVRRAGAGLELLERHPSAGTWFLIGPAHASQADAERAASDVRADVCVDGTRLVYRVKGSRYDSRWHAVYVRRSLAVHVATPTAPDCGAALAALPTLDAWLDAQVATGVLGTCDLLDRAGRADDAFACLLARPAAASDELWRRAGAEVAAGEAGRPDREARVLACFEGPAAPEPGCLRLLDRTTTAARRRALLERQLRACGRDDRPVHCLADLTLATEVGRLADAELCSAAMDRAEQLLGSGGPERVTRANELAHGVATCVPAERIDALARRAFLLEEAPARTVARLFECSRRDGERSRCASLPRLGARLRARDCAPADVRRSREAVAAGPMGSPMAPTHVYSDARIDGALRVLAACAPDEARAAIVEDNDAPIPRRATLEEYGVAPAPARP